MAPHRDFPGGFPAVISTCRHSTANIMELVLGLRVVRGPDWEWGDQDGGEGFVGTVAGLEEGGGAVIVQWDTGQRCRYRCGQDNKFDLRVLDSGPSGKLERFSSIQCVWCQEEDLVGCVWRCTCCLGYYLCSQCYITDKHSTRHPFFRIQSTDMKNRVRMRSRRESRRIAVKGIFQYAHIVRGSDWKWGNQDGGIGTHGEVVAIKDWQKESMRSVAEVQWKGKKKTNIYRLGHKGKRVDNILVYNNTPMWMLVRLVSCGMVGMVGMAGVVDLKCVEPSEGGSYYPDHLPILGADVAGTVSMEVSPQRLVAGDIVKVELEVAVLREMQQNHGGWNDTMASVIGQVGIVNYVHDSGDIDARFIANQIYKFNADAVSKVEGLALYYVGDVVMVKDDMALVHSLQKDGPGWVDDMALTLGQVGMVTKLTFFSHVQVSVNGKRWVFDPHCLITASADQLPDNFGEEDVDMNAKGHLLTLMSSVDRLDLIVLAAAAGDEPTVQQILNQHPEEVNRIVEGRTALHEACKDGYISVLKTLLKFNPDLEKLDVNGLRPIHSCAYSNRSKAMSLLLDHDADVNSKDTNERTALMVTAALGHDAITTVLLTHPLLNIQAGGRIGETALQCAVTYRRMKSITLLLVAGADPSIADYTASSPLHHATGMGQYAIVEKMLMYFPEHINFQKSDDGYSPLHIAAVNTQCGVLELLLQQGSCNINIQTSTSLTCLHMAAHEGHTEVIELLVGYGADLNTCVDDGNTALHLILARRNMKPGDTNTPHLMKVKEKLETEFGRRDFAWYAIVACMFLQEGADLYKKNTIGHSPLAISPPEITDILHNVVGKCGRGSYHGSLRKSFAPLPKLHKSNRPAVVSGVETVKAFKNVEKQSHSDRAENTSEPPSVAEDFTNKQRNSPNLAKGIFTEDAAKSPTDIVQVATDDSSNDRLCCMCDQEVNVRLSPCGHTVMCSDCAHIAKRCPTCRVPIGERLIIS